MPATNVPCPRPSVAPGSVLSRVERLTLPSTPLLAKSGRSAWTPESTTAIVGVWYGFGEPGPAQSAASPASYGQSWLEVYPLTLTGASGVTVSPLIAESL